MLLCKNIRLFTLPVGILFTLIKYDISIPIRTIPSSPKLLPFPWESHENPMGMGILIPMIPIPMHTSNLYAPKTH